MDNDQARRFRVLEQEKGEISEVMKKETGDIFLTELGIGFNALAAIYCIAVGTRVDSLFMLTGALELGVSIQLIKVLINSIVKKTNLKISIEDIDNELAALEEQSGERRGMAK